MKLFLLHQYYNAGGGSRSNGLRYQPPPGLDSGVGTVEGVFRYPAHPPPRLPIIPPPLLPPLHLPLSLPRCLYPPPHPHPAAAVRGESDVEPGGGRPPRDTGPAVAAPESAEVMKARLMEVVQREQRVQYGWKSRRPLIVVTPTHVPTFQALHLTGLAQPSCCSPVTSPGSSSMPAG